MAEAQVQAETQTGALNPHEAVAAISQMIEREATPQTPRDDKGKFTKAEAKTEAATPTEATEEPAKPEVEAAPPADEQVEIQPEPRRFKLKYKGEELEKEESEVVSLAQQGFDYTQKSQALAKEREELGQKIKTETEAAQKRYEQQLELHRQAVLKLADPEAMSANLDKLSQEDPARALQLMIKRNQIHQTLGAIAQEQQRIAQQREAETLTAKQRQVQEALEVIQREIPDWGAEKYGKILKTATSNGFTQEEANAITDPKVVKLLDKVRQYDEIVAAKPKTVDKRVAQVPKVTKPGTAQEKPNPNAERFQKSMDRLSKTGNKDDAVDMVRQMLESGRL